jgi:Ca2+-binding RTX toxin-like protein
MQDPVRLDWVNIAGATSTTFTPANQHIAQPLRVVMTFTDNAGVQERVVSAATGVTQPDLAQNTAPFIVPQQGVTGIPDTNALTNKAFDLFLPLVTTFGDNETNPALLTYSATLASGAALSTVGLTFTTVPDGAGGITGAHITGTVTTAGPVSIRVTATDGGPGTPMTVTDTFIINVQQPTGVPTTALAPEVFTGSEDIQKSGTLLAGTDTDGDALGFRLVQNSATNGAVSINATTGAFLFNPSLDFAGAATFQYYVTDGLYNSAPKTVTINFAPVDDGTADVLLTGTAALGGTLGAFVGFDPDGEVLAGSETYQWLFDGNTILGATNADYVVQTGDVGHNISVRVTYLDGQGNLNNGLSGNLAPAVSEPIFIGTLGVTGVTGLNSPTMTAASTIVDPDGGPVAPEYVWETSLNGTTNWTVASAGVSADTATFSPTGTTTAAGAFVRVRMTYVDDGSNLENIVGDATHYIINGNNSSTLTGTAAADLIWGQGGNDQITAGAGNDFVQGGSNGDTFFATVNDGDDIYDGGTGTDTYVMTATAAAANVNLTAGTATSAQTGNDQLISIENVTGSSGNNVIVGSAGSNTLIGNGGNDSITGLAGGDTIDGGTGNDTFFFTIGDGNDDYTGGTGSDTIDLSGITGNTTLNLNSGNASGTQIGNDTLSGIENIIGGAGNDTITGSTQANILRGGAGSDNISAGSGNDTFVAVAGDGNDTYNGQGGTDTLDLSLITTATTVRLDLGTASGVSIGNDTISNIERILGGSGIDTITAGNAPETFTGNGGADIFQFRSAGAIGSGAGNRAVITDFAHGVDKIDLRFLDANQSSGGTQHFTFGGVISGASNPALGQVAIRHLTVGGEAHTYIEGNIQGFGGNNDFQIDLLGNIAIDANDFLFGP